VAVLLLAGLGARRQRKPQVPATASELSRSVSEEDGEGDAMTPNVFREAVGTPEPSHGRHLGRGRGSLQHLYPHGQNGWVMVRHRWISFPVVGGGDARGCTDGRGRYCPLQAPSLGLIPAAQGESRLVRVASRRHGRDHVLRRRYRAHLGTGFPPLRLAYDPHEM